MKELMMKARSGVTLVELLVVILIVTILSVSMLPLLQPFVVQAQYAAETIPVIGNIRTKIGMFQYDKGKLPCFADNEKDATTGQDTDKISGSAQIETWIPVATQTGTDAVSAETADYYCPAYGDLPSIEPPVAASTWTGISTTQKDDDGKILLRTKHLSGRCDIDYQELKGKRSKPHNYQYLVMRNGTSYAYFVGCFGDGNGLKMGTGYAVCEIVADGHKYVGTWERYKAVSDADGNDVQLCFTTKTDDQKEGTKQLGCVVPDKQSVEDAKDDGTGKLDIVTTMETYGWVF